MSARPTPTAFKRPLDGIFSISTFLKSQTHEKPLRNALYNVGVIMGVGLIVSVTLVLWPFLKPMLWAFLFGAVLFPAKRNISNTMNSWLDRMEQEDRPLLMTLVIIPFETIDCYGKYIVDWFISHLKIILICGASLFGIKLLVNILPAEFFLILIDFVAFSHRLFGSLTSALSTWMVVLLVFVYLVSVCFLWKPQMPSNSFQIASNVIWIVLLGYFCSFLGAFQVPAFVCLFTYCIVAYALHTRYENLMTPNEEINEEATPAKTENVFKRPQTPTKDNELESDQYFKILFYACVATILWKYSWIVFLGLISTSLYLVKWLATSIGVSSHISAMYENYRNNFEAFMAERRHVIFPVWLPAVLELNLKTHKFLLAKAKSYIDDLSSIIVILGLVFSILFISIFSFVQIYSETIAVAQLGGNLINRTMTYRPELIEMLPLDIQNMDDIIDNAHKYGRTTISTYVDNIFNDTDPNQAKKLKNQILTVWDRLIQSYLDRNNGENLVGPRAGTQSLYDSLGEIVTNPSTKAGIIEWAKSNLGMIMEVGDSVWLIVRTNLTLLLSAFGTLFSIVLGGGHAVIKFLLNSIIFFTCLYYLLQNSKEKYAPIAVNAHGQWTSRFACSIEASISSVLVATLKLAVFHGVFTWLTHTIFGAHIVYLPSVLASLFAAAPFLETYWCSIPAFLDLWLSQDKFWLACLLVIIHYIVPSNFNPIIHSEIKGGGHPYLTGLSIAGGIYLLGLEGAVVGPLLLCLLVVLFDITKTALKETPQTPHAGITRQSSLDATGAELYSQSLTS